MNTKERKEINKLMGDLGDLVSELVMTEEQADKIRDIFIKMAIEVNG